MTRPLILTLLLATAANAATITHQPWWNGSHLSGLAETPLVNHLLIRDVGNPTPIAQWSVPDVMPNDAMQTFVLDATTAASYGVDWGIVKDAFENPDGKLFNDHLAGWRPLNYAGNPLNHNFQNHPVFFDRLDSLSFVVDYFIATRIGSAWRAGWVARGEGYIVPEPGAWWMILLSLGELRARRQRR